MCFEGYPHGCSSETPKKRTQSYQEVSKEINEELYNFVRCSPQPDPQKYFWELKKIEPERFERLTFDTNGHEPYSETLSSILMDFIICGIIRREWKKGITMLAPQCTKGELGDPGVAGIPTLEEMLRRDANSYGVVGSEYILRVLDDVDERLHIYVRPSDRNGTTLDFWVKKNNLTPLI